MTETSLTIEREQGSPASDAPAQVPEPRPSRLGALLGRLAGVRLESWVTFTIVGACCTFVFAQLHPDLLLSNTTPSGGDMGAHVWGPAYLRDHLIPSGRLSGWTPDWYAGFPAYQFYMVVPSLLILLLDLVLPYGIAFKLITVSGAIALPLSAWAFGRLARLPFPTPALFSVAATVFLFDRSYSIYGGNIASTLAGEFAFTMSFAFALLYLGVVARGLETGRYRGWAALLLALCGLCHLIPAFLAVAGTLVWWLVWCGRDAAAVLRRTRGPELWPAFWTVTRKRTGWLVTMAPVGALLSAFWVLPFYGRQRYLNDMGWVKETKFLDFLFFRDEVVGGGLKDAPELTWIIAFAVVGAFIALVFRQRAGIFLLIMAVLAGMAFVWVPQGRLWNTRLLPFYYLCLYLLAALAIGQLRLLLRSQAVRRVTLPCVAVFVVVLQTAIIERWSWQPPGFSKPILFDDRFLPFVMVGIGLMAAILVAEVVMTEAAVRRRTGLLALAMSLAVQVLMVARSSLQADDRLLPWFYAFLAVAAAAGFMELVRADLGPRRQFNTALVAFAVAILVLALLGPDGWNSGARLLPYFYVAVGLVTVAAVLELRDALRAPAWESPTATTVAGGQPQLDVNAAVVDGDLEPVSPPIPPVSNATLSRATLVVAGVVAAAAGLLAVALPLHVSPGSVGSDQVYRLGPLSTSDASFVDGWAAWNYRGYEAACAPDDGSCAGGGNKPYFPEYEAVVRTMQQVGEENGCGRAMWEYSSELDSYGTPMALMLLPHWTDGCIGSMEGLYFEASTTTPYHFLNQDQLSAQGSNAQRGLPYSATNSPAEFDLGVKHLQMLGVRYYMASSSTMVELAQDHEDLTEIATSPQQCRDDLCPEGVEPADRWVIFEVADSALVEPLVNEPVVLTGVGQGHTCETVPVAEDPRGRECEGWLDPAVDWYQDPSLWPVPLAESGPDEWERIAVDQWLESHDAPVRPVDPVEVSGIETDTDTISFEVDEVGSPVVVKASYFPNWKVDGAEGPYRITPNLMVVVPTDNKVTLSYGYTTLDLAAWMLTLLGIVAMIVLFRRRPIEIPSIRQAVSDASARLAAERPAQPTAE